jgi:cytochrome c-type protein NapB
MSRILAIVMPVVLALLGASNATVVMAAEQAGVVSERGAIGVDDEGGPPPEWHQYRKDGQPIARDYLQQPPLIPHKIDGYQVTMKYNKCLGCHSWRNYKEAGATKISQTHFASRDGAVLANVSARRYFCTQCHVPQTDAPPIVGNTFEAVEALQPR